MKRRYLLGIYGLLLGLAQVAYATHIVGGEFVLVRLDANSNVYQLSLNLYFDEINGDPQAEDQRIIASIFRKKDNLFMRNVELPKTEVETITYTNAACTSTQVKTRLIRYKAPLTLGADFDDPEGYYVVWERCCRNRSITNIQQPGNVGNTFYLEFPAPMRNGVVFVNSSPAFVKPKGDYVCLNQPFVFDFGAVDLDGDQLRYSLVTPYKGYSSPSSPVPVNQGSSAYPLISWAPGMSLDNSIPGLHPLRVDSTTGRLTVTAGVKGLFVFSVLCEEFRNHLRIGAVRRDYQLVVIDCPQDAGPPQIALAPNGQNTSFEKDTLVVNAMDGRCFTLAITDPDSRTHLNVSLQPLNFVNDQGVTLSLASGTINQGKDSLRISVCWSPCWEKEGNRSLLFQAIVLDETCPAPKGDTLLVNVQVQSKPNQPPSLTIAPHPDTLWQGQVMVFDVEAEDADGDTIVLEAIGRDFDLASVGMHVETKAAAGRVQTRFQWEPTCEAATRSSYIIDFVATEKQCKISEKAMQSVELVYQLTPNQPPTIQTDLENQTIVYKLNEGESDTLPPIGSPIRFEVMAEDADPEKLLLRAVGRGFDLTEVGIQFEEKNGISQVVSSFLWSPGCAALQGNEPTEYVIDFIAQDASCIEGHLDTTTVSILVQDTIVNYIFEPANVFTPNHDGKNDFFALHSTDFASRNLPPNNCQEKFESIEVYNRWGKRLFYSSDRNFRWSGDRTSAGEYFYLIRYTRHSYKGLLTLIR